MNSNLRSKALLAASIWLAGPAGLAQSSGATIYKAKCLVCHGTDGLASSGVGKVMKVKPATDPDVRKMSEAEMIAATRNGMGRMQPHKDSLTDAEIKASVAYFRTFVK
jgi:mono/diheme cytochrome c family protein